MLRHRSIVPLREGVALLVAAMLALSACSGADDAPAATTPPTTIAPLPSTTTTSVPEGQGRTEPSYSPVVGECYDLRTAIGDRGRQSVYYLVFGCELPHEHEVYATVEPPATETPATAPTGTTSGYPGDEALRRFARVECPQRFAEYVGQVYELSRFTLGYVIPPPERWPHDRRVGCTLSDSGGRTAGSARGSRL